MQRVACLALGLALLGGEAARAGEPRLSGRIESEWAFGINRGHHQKLETSLLPELEWEFAPRTALTAVGRIRVDAFDRIEPGHPRSPEVSSLSRRGFAGDNVDYELRELFVETTVGGAYLTVGKQQVVWGQADGLKVLDLVNPQSFREFILDEFEDSRIPLWAVNLEVPIGDFVLQGVWQPDPSFHEIPEPDALYAFTAPRFLPPRVPGFFPVLDDVNRPRRLLADSDAGLRISTTVRGFDLSLNYLYHYDDRYVFRGRRSVTELGPTIVFTPEYERTHLIGGTFASAFGDLTVRGEVGYSTDRYLSTTDPRETDALVNMGEIRSVLGFDWFGVRDTFLSLQVFQSWLLSRADGLLRERLDTDVTLVARRSFLNDRLRAEAIWIHNLKDADGLVRPRVTYELATGLSVWLGFDLFYGRDSGTFGEFNDRDRAVLGMQWGF